MKRRLITVIILSVVVLSSCADHSEIIEYDNLHSSFYNNEDETNIVDLSILGDDSITKDTKSITVTYENLSNREITYNDEIQLEYLYDGSWMIVPFNERLNRKLNTGDYILLPNDNFNHEINIYEHFGKWQEGHYRIIKSFKDRDEVIFKSVEFKVK